MYIPASFGVHDEATVLSCIERYSFSTIITSSSSDGMIVTHLPLLLKRPGDHPDTSRSLRESK